MTARPRSAFAGARPAAFAAAAALAAALAAGCTSVTRVVTTAGAAAGVITPEQAESINKSAAAIEKSYEDITPEQEYYIGRAVAATVLVTYAPYDAPAANEYLNLLGQTLSLFGAAPETFGGYHFILLDTEEINAFSAPGGLVMISRGMVRLCGSEDELAAVLAHEIGHVENQHGLRAIKKGRLTSAVMTMLAEGGKSFGGAELAQLTEAFENCIGDIAGTLMNSGYARATEYEADASALAILRSAGYDPAALVGMLREMQKRWVPNGPGFGRTHPEPSDRIAEIQAQIGAAPAAAAPSVRVARFKEKMRGV
ncbi:MAG TPA: peptidase M48 [Planctomycetes bacterium]|nr:peptidase M48 [Planctomycetota bacterium]